MRIRIKFKRTSLKICGLRIFYESNFVIFLMKSNRNSRECIFYLLYGSSVTELGKHNFPHSMSYLISLNAFDLSYFRSAIQSDERNNSNKTDDEQLLSRQKSLEDFFLLFPQSLFLTKKNRFV